MAKFPWFSVLAPGVTAQPNILFLLGDDIGWGDLSFNTEAHQPGSGGAYTVNPARTPYIDDLANHQNTMQFRRFYSASPVCSPTRASLVTGRNPERSCVRGAQGCGSSPAWSCYAEMPLPETEYSVATAAKTAGYATTFIGKWHLGDFWIKDNRTINYATTKWPSSHPGLFGFDEWHATEASAGSSTLNCGCNPEWLTQGDGCIKNSGKWTKTKLPKCTNYWFNTNDNSKCQKSESTTRDCVANLTSKIVGDDSLYMVGVFEDFLSRQNGHWFAHLSFHTLHEPHPAMPEWYNAYTEAEGGPAGDYLGTLSQWDYAIGQVIDTLKVHGAYENTMIWFTTDNGPHTKNRPSGQSSATNGLRQCKASVFEGGIRVPGFIHWPGVIEQHVVTDHAAVTSDFMPTVLDLIGLLHPRPNWAADGMSLLPLLTGAIAPTSPRTKPIGFKLHAQEAWQEDFGSDGVWKLVKKPNKGQCDVFDEPYASMTSKELNGPFLFNLSEDPLESNNLCSQYQDRCDSMSTAMNNFMLSLEDSARDESQCLEPVQYAV